MPTGMTFTDISAILAAINKAATGQELDSPIIKTADFVSVATATLLTGYDNLCNAISQVMTRTMFAVRPYTPQFRALQMDGSAYGNHERKINYIDTEPVKDVSYSLPADGTSTGADPFEVHRPKVLQTNFYGQVNYSRVYSQGRVQLNAAFTGPDQLAEFWTAFAMHYSNMRAQDDENLCRNLIANYMGGLTKTAPTAVYYLLDEYNAQTGKSLTATSVYAPENFPDFARFAYARIKDVSDLLQARSINNHQNWTIGGTTFNIMRHTPKALQHLYLFSQTQHQINARVLSDTFHDLQHHAAYPQSSAASLSVQPDPAPDQRPCSVRHVPRQSARIRRVRDGAVLAVHRRPRRYPGVADLHRGGRHAEDRRRQRGSCEHFRFRPRPRRNRVHAHCREHGFHLQPARPVHQLLGPLRLSVV